MPPRFIERRALSLFFPLLILIVLCWMSENVRQAIGPDEGKEESSQAKDTKPFSTAASADHASVNHTVLWQLSERHEGDPNALRPAVAAASRSRNQLPEGRRWRAENFPDLRTLREGQRLIVSLPEQGTFPSTVMWSRKDKGFKDRHMVVLLFDGEQGVLNVADDRAFGRIKGHVILASGDRAWSFDSTNGHELWLREHLRGDLICEMRSPVAAMRENPLPGDLAPPPDTPPSPPPILHSRPEATATLFLDFDGEPPTIYPNWILQLGILPFEVPHSGLSQSAMEFIWRRVAEDYIQFQVNVTTDAARYAAAPVGRRMRVLIGGTLPAGIGGGGVAWMNSFRAEFPYTSDVPCWVVVDRNLNGSTAPERLSMVANAVSHEFGHTLGLWHDGNDGLQPNDANFGNYYPGHGTPPDDWSPIMGAYFRVGSGDSRTMVQWARNSYTGANNAQDDIGVIASAANGFGMATDESTSTLDADPLELVGPEWVGATGIIQNASDQDWWRFTIAYPGTATVEVAPAESGVSLPNLDCGFHIADSNGNNISGDIAPENSLEAIDTRNLLPGTYYVVVKGTGRGSFANNTGYDNYGSTGRYVVTVVPPPENEGPLLTITSPVNNSILNGSIQFRGTASDISGLHRLELKLQRGSDGAYWNGVFWSFFPANTLLSYTFQENTNNWTCTAVMPQTGQLGGLTPGEYLFQAKAIDSLGNDTYISSTLIVDGTGPSVTILSPASGSLLGTPGLNFFGTVTENGTLQYVVSYIRRDSDGFYWNGSGWQSGTSGAHLSCNLIQRPNSTTYDWTCTAPLPSLGSSLTPGSYTFITIAVDGAGLLQQRDAVVNVDSTAPVTSISAPTHQSIITTSSVPFHGTITDNAGVWRVVCFIRRHADNHYWNGSAWILDPGASNLSTSYNSGTGTWTCSSPLPVPGGSLPNGGYNFIALGFDHAGNTHQVESVVTVDYHPIYTWNGSLGTDWDNAGNWTPNGIPGANDYVVLNNGGTVVNNAQRTVYGFRLSNGSMTSSSGNALTFTNDSIWSGGSIGGTWKQLGAAKTTFNNASLSSPPPGTLLNNAALMVNESGNLTLAYPLQQQANGRIRNNGANIYLSGGGEHFTGSVLDAAAGSIYLNGGTHTFYGGAFEGNGMTFCTNGTANIQGDVGAVTGAATGGFGIAGGSVTGSGRLSAERGYLSTGSIGGNVTLRFTSTLTKQVGTTFNMNGGTLVSEGLYETSGSTDFNLDSSDTTGAGTIVNRGIWRLNNASTYSNTYDGGAFINQGMFESLLGNSTLHCSFQSMPDSTLRANAGILRLSGGGVQAPGSTLHTNGGDIYYSNGTHQLLGGSYTGSGYVYATGGTVSVEGNVGSGTGAATGGFGISSGTVVGTAMISAERGIFLAGTVGGSVTLRFTGASTKSSNSVLNMNGGTIRNEGTFTQQASGDFNLDQFSGGGAGNLTNSGTWIHSGGNNITNSFGSGSIDNFGLWHISSGNNTNYAYFTHHEGSTFRVTSGQMIFMGGSKLEVGATIDAGGGSLYQNDGTHTYEGGVITGANTVYTGGGNTVVTGNVGAATGAATGGFGIYASGLLSGNGQLSVDHSYFAAGTMTGTVTLRITGSSNKAASTTLNMNGGTILNEGTFTGASSADFNLDSGSSTGAGTLHNKGTWRCENVFSYSNSFGGGVFRNEGLLESMAGISIISGSFLSESGSTFRVKSGYVRLSGGGVQQAGSTLDTDGGDIYYSGGTHQLLGGTYTGTGFVYATGGTVSVEGNVGAASGTASGGFGISSGTVVGTAMISAERGSFLAGTMGGSVTLRYTGASTKWSNSILNMNGGTIRNEGTFTQQASGDFNLDNFTGGGAGNLTNTGTWIHSGGNQIANTNNNGTIDNFGLWHVSSGNSTNAAYFTHHDGSTYRVSGGQMIFTQGSRLKPGAEIEVNNGYLYLNGGTHTLEGGSITGPFFVYSGSGVTTVTGDVGATSGPATGGYGIYSTGTLNGSATISVDHGYLAAGTVSGSVTLRLTGESNKITNTTLNMSGGTIRNEGTMNVAASGDINLDNSSAAGGGTIINTGLWKHLGSCTFSNSQLGGTVQNSGNYEIHSGTTSMSASFSNSGTTRVIAGSLIFQRASSHSGGLISNGSISFVGSGHSVSGSNAFLGGAGSFSGAVTLANAARLAPGNSAGTLTLNGNVQFLSSTEAPAVAIELETPTQFDQIMLGNGASLSLGTGVTDLLLDLSFRPTPGQTFRIVSAGTSTGTFSGRFRNAPVSGNLISATYQGYAYQFRVHYDAGGKFIDLVYQSGYQLWIAQNSLTGNDALFNADPDGDGVPNGLEFLMGRDPRPGFPDPLTPGENTPLLTQDHVIFVHRRVAAARYLPVIVQYNSDLSPAWNTAQAGVNGVTIANEADFYGNGIDKVETRIPRSLAIEGRLFMRLSAEE